MEAKVRNGGYRPGHERDSTTNHEYGAGGVGFCDWPGRSFGQEPHVCDGAEI